MSDLLVDSHAFLWYVWDDPNLERDRQSAASRPGQSEIRECGDLLEIAIKVGLKKLNLGEPATTFVPRELAASKISLLDIELAHATFVETLPPHHKDPFDRLLVAQAMIEKLRLVSVDAIFDRYGVTRLWK